jgi:hypothetical protein
MLSNFNVDRNRLQGIPNDVSGEHFFVNNMDNGRIDKKPQNSTAGVLADVRICLCN